MPVLDDDYPTSDANYPYDLACPPTYVGSCSIDTCGCSEPSTVYDAWQPIMYNLLQLHWLTLWHWTMFVMERRLRPLMTKLDIGRYFFRRVLLTDKLNSVARASNVAEKRPLRRSTVPKKLHSGHATTTCVHLWICPEFCDFCVPCHRQRKCWADHKRSASAIDDTWIRYLMVLVWLY